MSMPLGEPTYSACQKERAGMECRAVGVSKRGIKEISILISLFVILSKTVRRYHSAPQFPLNSP